MPFVILTVPHPAPWSMDRIRIGWYAARWCGWREFAEDGTFADKIHGRNSNKAFVVDERFTFYWWSPLTRRLVVLTILASEFNAWRD
jgi:hypothetical protein